MGGGDGDSSTASSGDLKRFAVARLKDGDRLDTAGDPEGAALAYAEALGAGREVRARWPDAISAVFARNMALCGMRLGYELARVSDLDHARAAFEAAAGFRRLALAMAGDTTEDRRGLAGALSGVALAARRQSDWVMARDVTLEELELRRGIVATASSEVRDLDRLADALLGLASADEELGEPDTARARREETVAVLRDAIARSDDLALQRTLVVALEGLALVCETLGDAAAATDAAAGAVAAAERLERHDPTPRHSRMLGDALRLLATRQAHDRDQQLATWERSVAVLQQSLELHRDDETRRTLAEVLIAAAVAARETGRTDRSVALAAHALSVMEELRPGPPTVLLRAHGLLTMADATAATRSHRRDAAAYRAALAALEPIEARVVEMDGASVLLAILHGLALAADEDGDRASAEGWIERYLAVCEQTVDRLERVGSLDAAHQLRRGLTQARWTTNGDWRSAPIAHWREFPRPPTAPPDTN